MPVQFVMVLTAKLLVGAAIPPALSIPIPLALALERLGLTNFVPSSKAEVLVFRVLFLALVALGVYVTCFLICTLGINVMEFKSQRLVRTGAKLSSS